MKKISSKNNNLLNWIVLLPVIGVLITSFTLTNVYINSIHANYEKEVSELEKNYLKNIKQKIKNRIDNVSNTIDKNYTYQLRESQQVVKHYINLGHSILNTIYENNKDKSKKEIYKIIDDQMKEIRFFDNNSGYFFIYDAKDAVSISLPASPSFVGKSLINLEDENKKNLFNSYKDVMKETGEGFDTWYWNKPSSKNKSKKIGFVKLFRPLNIVIGTAIYEEDIKQNIAKISAKIIADLKFQDDAYIFVVHADGTVISHRNKDILGVPLEELSPIVQKNVTLILDKAKKNNEGFIEYNQDKKLFDDFTPSKKISYIVYNKKLNWVIGTGLYTDNLNLQIKEKKQVLEERLNKNINLIILISIGLSLIIVLIVMIISKKIKRTFTYYSNEINNKNEELEKLNMDLEDKINKQVNSLRKKDLILNQQSKLVAMGEMLGNIAHQWRQPLSAISTLASGIRIRKEMNMISEEQIDADLKNIVTSTQVLSQTIDDFKNFYSHQKEKVEFEIDIAIQQVFNLISSNLESNDIIVEKNTQNIKCISYKNELIQVLLNIINNAKDALLDKLSEKFIFINTKQVEDNLVLEIYDNAGGIKEDIMDRIFEPYFTTKFKSQGTGIGLYMSKNIIEQSLDGSIHVENYTYQHEQNSFTGAKFIIEIPIKD